ncbi:MAG: alanine--tRNA ligase [Bacteroidota bacterium]|nr:alanine--tRNA ligase [Bacteroidota bacterium]
MSYHVEILPQVMKELKNIPDPYYRKIIGNIDDLKYQPRPLHTIKLKMTSTEIRNSFLKFFEARGHRIVPSASVIPYDDPTLLFTNAGMNQFKDVFLGTGKRDYVRAVNSQKCIRVSGKHNDLEEVGRDTYHHTFFEMLGNWSLGDYYKKKAIEWAWELLTKVWGLDKKRLYATVYESDDEAEQLWKNVTDIDPIHVLRFGKKDNFWEMGETGPCGPCSEIHVDLTDDLSGGKLVNAGDPRVMEIWNLVFIQYNHDEKGALTQLPAKHVDTGMGFERMCAVLQGKKSNYDTDVFMPIINRISEIACQPYKAQLNDLLDIAMRVVADHARMLSFSIADGGIPSNEGLGYVMRRILRRGARFGRTLGLHEPFIYKVVEAVVQSMGEQFPEIKEKQNHIERVIKGEEESFNQTLDRGLEIFESVIEEIGHSEPEAHAPLAHKTFPGEDAFKLYDTFGFPLDLTEMMAFERGLKVDTGRFTELMEEQRSRARISRSANEVSTKNVEIGTNETKFTGYNEEETVTKIIELLNDQDGSYIVFDKSPFYTESGGQIADDGEIDLIDFGKRTIVGKVYKNQNGAIIHIVPKDVELKVGLTIKAIINKERRQNIMRNHTATHLLHEALRMILGEHLHQQGSLVAPDRLRFDFNHFEKITHAQIRAIEDIVNEKIVQSLPVIAPSDPKDWLPIEEAKRRYPKLKMFFGEKYGDKVRVVEVKDFTWELCGGTHVKNTKDIQLFKIISESSIASGIRRIEAVTGDGLKDHIHKLMDKAGEMDAQIEKLLFEKESLERQLSQFTQVEQSIRPSLGKITFTDTITGKVVDEVERAIQDREQVIETLSKSTIDLKKELSKYRVKEVSSGIESIVAKAQVVDGIKVVSEKVDVKSVDELLSLGDALRSKLGSGVGVLATVIDEKVSLVCVVTDDLIKNKKLQAGKIVGEIAKLVGGGGGGRPHLATAGGKDVAKLDEAMKQTEFVVIKMLE